MKLTRLKIHKYRGVAPGSELTFSPSLNLVLGSNGTGRTTLLELISTALGSDFSSLLREEFSLEYDLSLLGMRLEVSVRNEPRASSPRLVALKPSAAALLAPASPEATPVLEPFMQVVLQLEQPATQLVMRADSSGVTWEVDEQPGYSQSMSWSLLDRSVWVVLFMTAQYLEPEIKDRLKELLRRIFLLGPSRFDEALGLFNQLGTIRYAMEVRGSEVFPLGLMALPTWLPGWLRERVERGPVAEVLEVHHDTLERSFLSRFIDLAGFTRGTLRVALLDKRTYENGGRVEFGRFSFSFTRRDGSVLTAEQLGGGQKRLLSLLYYLDVNEDFVIADELANGLHPSWVEACLRERGERQWFLTSQSPLPIDHFAPSSPADVRSSLILCRLELQEGLERRLWSNPSTEEASKLFGAWREGRSPLSALLRSQGLW